MSPSSEARWVQEDSHAAFAEELQSDHLAWGPAEWTLPYGVPVLVLHGPCMADEFTDLANVIQAPPKKNELKECLMLAIPTFFDLVATILMNVGLLYVTASVYQMMRGAGMRGRAWGIEKHGSNWLSG